MTFLRAVNAWFSAIERPEVRFLLALIIAVAPWLFIGFTTTAEYCDKNEYTNAKECSTYYSSFVFWIHIFKFLQTYNGAITALATVAIVILTHRLSVATNALQAIEARGEEATRTIERAYVQLSHVSNDKTPGLRVNATSGECRVTIGVKNHGATPARVTRVVLAKRVLASALPAKPDYLSDTGDLNEQPFEAFLMKDVEIFVGFQFTIDVADLPLIKDRKKQLVVYGFVDYTDQFGRHFRGGYARNYVPDLLPNNLVFVPHPGYNYDEERNG